LSASREKEVDRRNETYAQFFCNVTNWRLVTMFRILQDGTTQIIE